MHPRRSAFQAVLPKGRSRWVAGAALTCAAVALLLIFILPWKHESRLLPYWIPLDVEVRHFRDVPLPMVDNYQLAVEAYSKHDVAHSLEYLDRIDFAPWRKDGPAIVSRLLRASSLLNGGDETAALEILRSLDIEFLPAPWRGEAGWLHYIALRQQGDATAACSLLHWLKDEPGKVGTRALSELERSTC